MLESEEEMDVEDERANEEEVEKVEEKEMPKFLIVEASQLIKLLQRCPECGKLPRKSRTGKTRTIKWTRNGTNMTATLRCTCINKAKIRWATQNFIPGTRTRVGNIAIVAAYKDHHTNWPI